VTENEAKEHARAPLNPARRRSGRSTRKLTRLRFSYGGFRQSARFFPSAPPMLGAGQWENQKRQTITPSCRIPEWCPVQVLIRHLLAKVLKCNRFRINSEMTA